MKTCPRLFLLSVMQVKASQMRGRMKLFSLLIIPGVITLHAATFEVASVKRAAPDARGSDVDVYHGVLRMRNVTLKRCIARAYEVPEAQVIGGPRWIGELRFDIDAKADHDAAGEEIGPMLQHLLSERFGLALHHEMRVLAGYALVVAKGGIKAPRSAEGTTSNTDRSRGRLQVKATSMPKVAMRLAAVLGEPVVDMTGVSGDFDFTLLWTPDDMRANPAETEPAEYPSLFTAIEEQLGLKLEARRAPADALVIDDARPPSQN